MAVSTATLDALPTECLAHVLSHLSLRDAAAAVCALKRFQSAAVLPVAWQPRLARVYDLQLQLSSTCVHPAPQATGRGSVDWPALYRRVEKDASLGAMRFRAIFTDGGMDEGEMRYWADNMFAANHWESHCSALGANVHIIGLLLGGRVHTDEEEAEHRAFMIDRLRIPAQVVFDSGAGGFMPHAGRTRLEAWSTSELEHFLQMLHQQMEMGMGLGRLLLAGVKAADVPAALAKLRQVCDRLGVRHSERADDIVTPPEQPDTMLDSRLLPLLRAPAVPDVNNVASVERITVSRAGHFSCPLRTGLVLLGDWRRALQAGADGCVLGSDQTVLARMQAIAADAVCRAYDGITDKAGLAALEQQAAAGQLPWPVAWGRTAAGEWLEFDRDWRPPAGTSSSSSRVRPVAWFRFFDADEAAAAKLCLTGTCRLVDLTKQDPHSYSHLPGLLLAGPCQPSEPQQAAGAADTSGSPAAAAADTRPVIMSQPAEAAHADPLGGEPAAAAGAADGAAGAASMSQLPAAVEADGLAEALGVSATEGTAAQELVDFGMDADDGFHLEDFQDPQLVPLDELGASDSEGDEDMFADDAAAQGGAPGEEGAVAAADGGAAATAHAAARAAARSTDGRSLLDIRLLRRHAGNLALVKLIDSENLMSAWHDEHEQPNIDVACIALRGRSVCLPDTVQYAG